MCKVAGWFAGLPLFPYERAGAPVVRRHHRTQDGPVNDLPISPLRALPDGNAELRVVLTLSWNDVASLGREAGRLATRLQRTVSLDEAASHVLSARPESAALAPESAALAPESAALARGRGNPALEKPAAAVPPQMEQGRQSTELMMRPAVSPTSSAPANATTAANGANGANAADPAAAIRPDAAAAPSRPTVATPATAPAA
ncbi:hypothetical protein [Kitasatospora camelliae]|uniref:Uncharacterized protein n=1 Tax=Kitasatospora camelliae TaxID=3156397 RepID=A0AAU8JRP0_9ACTN